MFSHLEITKFSRRTDENTKNQTSQTNNPRTSVLLKNRRQTNNNDDNNDNTVLSAFIFRFCTSLFFSGRIFPECHSACFFLAPACDWLGGWEGHRTCRPLSSKRGASLSIKQSQTINILGNQTRKTEKKNPARRHCCQCFFFIILIFLIIVPSFFPSRLVLFFRHFPAASDWATGRNVWDTEGSAESEAK